MKKDEFKQKTLDLLNELGDYITELDKKADDIADDAKEEYNEKLRTLKDLQKDLSEKFDKYQQIADSKWDLVKESAGNFFSSVGEAWKENFGKVADSFKKEKE